jgi:RsiW-degrading membrane proteinase PrsW (M82 family)
MNFLIALCLTLAAPLLLLPIEQLFPYSYILEEVFKMGIIFFLFLPERKGQRSFTTFFKIIVLGLVFTVSESVLYIFNFFQLGDFSLLGSRLLWTGILHCLTFGLIYVGGRSSKLGLLIGFLLACLIHAFFNEWLVTHVL